MIPQNFVSKAGVQAADLWLSGTSSFAFVGKSNEEEEKKRLSKIVVGLKLSLAYEVMYLISIYLVKFSMLFLYDRFA